MGIVVKNLGRLQAKLEKLDPVTRAAAGRGVQKAGILIEGQAKMLAPVDTGALRRSISTTGRSTANGAEAIVGTSLEYAPYVELGTSKQKAQPFLQPALQKNKTKAQSIVMTEIRNAYKGL